MFVDKGTITGIRYPVSEVSRNFCFLCGDVVVKYCLLYSVLY